MTDSYRQNAFEYSVESAGLPGEPESGDIHIVKTTAEGTLFAVIDGLGHGTEAAAAAQLAVKTIEEHAEEPISEIFKVCDEELRKTRGAAMALAFVNTSKELLTWLSVGNVDGILIHMDPKANPGYDNIFKCSGVVGYQLPLLFASVSRIAKNDLLILSTDGIKNDYHNIASDIRCAEDALSQSSELQPMNLTEEKPEEKPAIMAYEYALSNLVDPGFIANGRSSFLPKNLASFIFKNFLKGSDDALVLVAKFSGYSS